MGGSCGQVGVTATAPGCCSEFAGVSGSLTMNISSNSSYSLGVSSFLCIAHESFFLFNTPHHSSAFHLIRPLPRLMELGKVTSWDSRTVEPDTLTLLVALVLILPFIIYILLVLHCFPCPVSYALVSILHGLLQVFNMFSSPLWNGCINYW